MYVRSITWKVKSQRLRNLKQLHPSVVVKFSKAIIFAPIANNARSIVLNGTANLATGFLLTVLKLRNVRDVIGAQVVIASGLGHAQIVA
jgi:hypothetical protein